VKSCGEELVNYWGEKVNHRGVEGDVLRLENPAMLKSLENDCRIEECRMVFNLIVRKKRSLSRITAYDGKDRDCNQRRLT